ncbi:beta-galactosidase [Mycolicibacterium sp. Y3]
MLATAILGASVSLHPAPQPTAPRLAAAAVELSATIDSSSTTTGIAESDLYFMSKDQLGTAMQQLQSLGVTQIRVYLPWRQMEPAKGSYNWSSADQLLNTAASYGIAVDASVTSTPPWATTNGGLIPNGAPTSDADYATFVKALASRYGATANNGNAKISAYEVWNEPNWFAGWSPKPDATAYTALLKAAYTAIKSVDPTATVLGGVLGAGVTIGSLTENPVTFLKQMYAAGAAGYFDALAFHPYADSLFSAGASVANSPLQELEALRKLMNSNGDALKLIWATEYGAPVTTSSTATSGSAASQTNQATLIQDFLTTWSTLTGVGPSFLFSLIDSSYSGGNYGIFGSNWTPRAAVATIKSWIAAHPITAPVLTAPGRTVTTLAGALHKAITALAARIKKMLTPHAAAATKPNTTTAKSATATAVTSAPASTTTSTASTASTSASTSTKNAVSQESSTKTAESTNTTTTTAAADTTQAHTSATKTAKPKPSTKHIRGKHAAVKASS